MELVVDGTLDFVGGQDASKIPDSVPENAVYQAVNTTNKRGSVAPRWGFEKVNLTFEDGYITDSVKRQFTLRYVFEAGKFQAAIPFLIGTDRYIIFVISGYIFLYNQNSSHISRISISDGSILNPRASRVRWTLAGKYIILFDFPAYPVIIEGATARRADPTKLEIPISNIGTFNQNRLFVATAGDVFTAGDAIGNLAAPNAPISFLEFFTPGSPFYTQAFQLPTQVTADPITAMGFLQVSDTSTGIGPLLIGTDNAIYAYGTNQPRDLWAGTDTNSNPAGQFGSVLVQGAGIVGQRAWTNLNSDMFFISLDGHVRSLAMSRDEQKRWARVPVSREVEPWLKYWDRSLARYAFATYFNNKVFFSANPYRTPVQDFTTGRQISDYANGGLVVLEFDNVTAMGQASNPTWAGLWTGVKPIDMVTSGTDCFIVSKEGNINSLFRVNPEISYDMADGKIRNVRSRIYTREYNFKDPFQNKEAHSIDFNIDEILGDFKIDVKYKPSHSHGFHDWRSFAHYVPWRCCDVPDGLFLNGFSHQYIREFTLGAPNLDECDPVTKELYTLFRKCQLKITIEGTYWEIHEIRFKTVARARNETESLCEQFSPVAVPLHCDDDWYVGEFAGCQLSAT